MDEDTRKRHFENLERLRIVEIISKWYTTQEYEWLVEENQELKKRVEELENLLREERNHNKSITPM